jgi:hypothetical protein
MEVTFFKARKAGGGSAVKFNISDNGGVFITMFPQKGSEEKSFDWEKRVFAALNQSELGEMIAVIEGRIEGTGKREEKGDKVYYNGFYHSTSNSKTTIRFARYMDGIGVSVKSERNGTTGEYSCVLNVGELYALRELLQEGIRVALAGNAKYGKEPQRNVSASNEPAAASALAKTSKTTSKKSTTVTPGPVAAATTDDDIPF